MAKGIGLFVGGQRTMSLAALKEWDLDLPDDDGFGSVVTFRGATEETTIRFKDAAKFDEFINLLEECRKPKGAAAAQRSAPQTFVATPVNDSGGSLAAEETSPGTRKGTPPLGGSGKRSERRPGGLQAERDAKKEDDESDSWSDDEGSAPSRTMKDFATETLRRQQWHWLWGQLTEYEMRFLDIETRKIFKQAVEERLAHVLPSAEVILEDYGETREEWYTGLDPEDALNAAAEFLDVLEDQFLISVSSARLKRLGY